MSQDTREKNVSSEKDDTVSSLIPIFLSGLNREVAKKEDVNGSTVEVQFKCATLSNAKMKIYFHWLSKINPHNHIKSI